MKVYSIHCWEGSPKGYWQPWLKKELEAKGFEIVIPVMPNTANPKFNEWLSHMQKVVTKSDGVYFVGHSLGCITIMRFLETLPKGIKAKTVVMVAGFSDDLGYQKISSFFQTELDWEKIKNSCENFVAIFSDDDPHVPLKHADIFMEKLGAKIIIKKGRKHFGENTMPEVLDEISKTT
ncbi:MAG: hypothetical protein GOU98_03080 [Candidatus Altiarchaeota archaeon]|nr:hypothetical protein [Candidatus Altiarchaeota archaeon]